jgi:2-amino-4-hydroxy-6-hydroxymethyldihydropteridine diphosphokinase
LETERLTLPHPRIAERNFVMIPIADLTPGWVHPVSGKWIGKMIKTSQDALEVSEYIRQ